MNRRRLPTQISLFFVSLLALLLLIGSVVLSRIVFKAASAGATLYLSQPIISARPNTTFAVDVLADLSAATYIAGVQVEVNFDPNVLRPGSTEPAVFWKQVYSKVKEGKLSLVMVPLEPEASTNTPVTKLKLAHLTFTTLTEGTTNLALTPALSLLAVTNAPNGKGVENVVESVVDAQVRVSSEAAVSPEISSAPIEAPVIEDRLVFESQRIISTIPILTPSSALILVTLEHPSRVSVAFGQSTSLGNRADYSTKTDQAAIRIAGLDPGKRYFYQVSAEDENATNRVLGQLRSFALPEISPTNAINRAELTIFPTHAKNEATAYAVFFDRDNKIISNLTPELQTSNQQTSATKFSEVSALYQANLTSLTVKKQIARYTLQLNGQSYASASVMFNQSNGSSSTDSAQPLSSIRFDQKTINLILALLAALILLGFGFSKLARGR